MSELLFCRSFLSALDARPVKLSSDHIADARQYPAQGAYTLPRLPAPHPPRPNPKSTSTSTLLTLTLKPMKPTHPTLPFPSVDGAKTSIFDLKTHYATSTSIPAQKIKILYKKKPVLDSKTVAEVLGADEGPEVEFGVMIMGGAVAGVATPVQSPPASVPTESDKGLGSDVTAGAVGGGGGGGGGAAAVGPTGKELVSKDEFWGDLHNFVLQRIKDEVESKRLLAVFKAAWEENK